MLHINRLLKNTCTGRTILLASGFFLISAAMTGCGKREVTETTEVQKPNVILIFTDDQNNYETGCYGGNVSTPNMDKLAEEGVMFTRYYPCTSLCSPSRYSVLTGKYPSRCISLQKEYSPSEPVFIRWNTDIIEGERTIAHIMKEHGYATGFTGKWHNWEKGVLPLWHVPDREDPENYLIKPIIEKNYKLIKDHIKKTSGFDYVESVYGTNFNWLPITSRLMFHNQHWITYNSLRFIEQNKDKPFFLYMATTIPHGPGGIESLRGDPRATPAGFKTEHLDCQPSYDNILERAKQTGINNKKELNDWVTMTWLDDGVGVILKKLEELELRENTLIFLISDHGLPGKMTCYQGPAPFIMNWKGQIDGRKVSDELVSNVDVVPTILDACNVGNVNEKTDGMSLIPLLLDSVTEWRKSLYQEVTYTRGVVTKNYKYIATRFPSEIMKQVTEENRHEFNQQGVRIRPGGKIRYSSDKKFPGYFDDDQLYDLKADSLEQNNLAGSPEYERDLKKMQEALRSYCSDLPFEFGEFKNN